jgi:hypothetical protein
MMRLLTLMTLCALTACSGPSPDANPSPRGAPARIGAAALVRAYAADVDEADLEFVGHPLLISGDVVNTDHAGRLLLTTGDSAERLPATVAPGSPQASPRDLVSLRCDRIDRDGSRPRVSACTVTALIPARIAWGE